MQRRQIGSGMATQPGRDQVAAEIGADAAYPV